MDNPSSLTPSPGVPLVSAGTMLFERYRVIRLLCQELGQVALLAEDCVLPRRVHLTLVFRHPGHDPEKMKRLRVEVSTVMKLMHPALIPLIDWHEGVESVALVHEWREGETLAELLATHPQGCFDPHEILPWLESLAGLLDLLHSVGVCVGDLQPGRVVRDTGGAIGVRLPNLDRVLGVAPPNASLTHAIR